MAARDSLDSFDSADGLEQSREEYDEDLDSSSDSAALQKARILANNSLDETVDVSDAESSVDYNNSGKNFSQPARRKGDSPPQTAESAGEDDRSMYDDDDDNLKQDQNRSSYSADEGESSDGDDDGYQKRGLALSQNFDYSQLNVTHEIKELFDFIDKFKPADIELQTTLKPFIPEYIPAVGDIDAFLKILRPDDKPEMLGLTVLDEPSTVQTDPTVLELQLRATTKKVDLQPVTVRGIDNADKNAKAIKSWVQRIGDLHRTKPAPTVTYAKPMPDIDSLMQEWPNELEKLLESIKLPSADLDVDIKTFARIICAVVDIPVYNNITESLHVLFCLYSAFRENTHFRR
eukprot:TRINITY_DN679_c0_g1_i3.p1 TRINITY_DN679_c0_g1~~TRINITY_DN679_c0_g1_i3.p1  ORF type:complete len:347 (-),score=125.89 TRINITY_DN679_c0_g1_i3:326-1366(-)